MYIVVSKWEFLPGKREQFEKIGREMRDKLRSWPGVEYVQSVDLGNAALAIVGYTDEKAYQQLISDPNGPFEASMAQHDVESTARWLWSERGTLAAE